MKFYKTLTLFLIINLIGFTSSAHNIGTGNLNACSGTLYDSGGSVSSYSNSESFTETYCSNSSNCIQIVFNSFSTESCCDRLRIYDGPTTGSPLIGTYQGTTSPGTITSTSGCLTFQWSSDGSVTSTGWNATISCVACPPPGHNIGTGNLSACSGTLYDTGGSLSSYSNSESFTETYCSNNSTCIQVVFNSFSTESCCDDLSIYDGPTTGSPIIGTYQGTTSPGTITSTSGCLTFQWSSDGSVTSTGWDATISCVACPVPTCSDGIQNQGETGIDCGGPCPPCAPIIIPTACSNTTQTLTTLSSITFYDDGGAGGAACADQTGGGNYCNCNCFTTTTICAAPGEFIVADFREFAMWNTTSGWDWMKIYDNNAASGPVLYDNSSTGANNPFGDCGKGATAMNFCSSGQCLTFEFWATSVVNRAGWDALVSSVAVNCTLPIELINFTVEDIGNENILRWTTASEINNSHFIIETSNDAAEFNAIGYVQGNGNSNNINEYSFIDKYPNNDITFYRLRQYDFNGDNNITNVISIKSREKDHIEIYPNPSSNLLYFELEESGNKTLTIRYTNVIGSIIEEKININSSNYKYKFEKFKELKTGIYFVSIIDEFGNSLKTEKIIKQ